MRIDAGEEIIEVRLKNILRHIRGVKSSTSRPRCPAEISKLLRKFTSRDFFLCVFFSFCQELIAANMHCVRYAPTSNQVIYFVISFAVQYSILRDSYLCEEDELKIDLSVRKKDFELISSYVNNYLSSFVNNYAKPQEAKLINGYSVQRLYPIVFGAV